MQLRYKTSGRGDILQKFIKVMANDEHLLRLLYYNPIDENGNYIEITDASLPNITEMDEEKKTK